MSLSTNQSIIRGTFTSDGASEVIALPWLPSFFRVRNITQFGSAAAATPVMIAERSISLPQASALTYLKTNGAATIAIPTMNLTDGISFIDNSTQLPGAPITGTAITAANPAVVTATAHGLAVGDIVRIYNTTGMLQIAGMEFSVTAVPTVNTFTLGTLDASGFAAPATAATIRTVPLTTYYPRNLWITNISQAVQAVVQLSTVGTNQFEIGQEIRLVVPAEFGMIEADNQRARITAVNNTTGTITLDLNTSAFTAFAFPTSATAAAGVNFPQVIPFGKFGEVGVNAQFNQWRFQVQLGTNALGGNNDIMEWVATRALDVETAAI